MVVCVLKRTTTTTKNDVHENEGFTEKISQPCFSAAVNPSIVSVIIHKMELWKPWLSDGTLGIVGGCPGKTAYVHTAVQIFVMWHVRYQSKDKSKLL